MDMDDDFMGEVEFDLTAQQQEIVSRAIDLASRSEDQFSRLNPLIAIMQWWEKNADQDELTGSPEARLAKACQKFLRFHQMTTRSGNER